MSTTAAPTTQSVNVGVAVFITSTAPSSSSSSTSTGTPTRHFLMGKRLSSHGHGTWALPGGHLEYGESFATCAARETLEETGLTLPEASLHFLTATNTVFKETGKHYVTIFMTAELRGGEGEVRRMEPDKCAGWEWVTQQDLGAAYGQAVSGVGADGRGMVLFEPMVEVVRQLGPDRWVRGEVL